MSSHSSAPGSLVALEVELDALLTQRELLDATELIAHIGHCQWDYDNNSLLSCSLGSARIFNMSVDEIIELQSDWNNSLSMIHPDDRELYLSAYQSQQETGSYRVEYRFIRNDGQVRWLREVGLLKFDKAGVAQDAFGILQDITEQVEHAQNLEDRQELARQVEAITDIGHFINDEENDLFLYVSPGYARIHGRSVDEFMAYVETQQDNLHAVHADDREILRAKIVEYIETGADDFDAEYRVVHPDGKIAWVRERSVSRSKKDGRVTLTLGVLQDITAKREAEQKLRAAHDSLEATVAERTAQLADSVERLQQEIVERKRIASELEAKNAELERFAYTASHDLKTPLVTIKGFLGFLARDLGPNQHARVAADIDKINLAVDKMGQMLDDLLELSRIGQVVGEILPCQPTELAREAVALNEVRVREHDIEILIDEMPPMYGDPNRLLEVYQNLAENAIKFSAHQPRPAIEFGSRVQGDDIVYYVRDNGSGIPDEYHEKVFDLFERLDDEVDGTGVGLTLVRRIIEFHGGSAWIESPGDGGCRVCFTLPPTTETLTRN